MSKMVPPPTRWSPRVLGFVGALIFEGFTLLFRFGLGLQSYQQTSALAPYTLGYRIHHGYIGALLLLAAPFTRPKHRFWCHAIGIALLVSDLGHHFVFLWWIVGDPQFDLRYPTP